MDRLVTNKLLKKTYYIFQADGFTAQHYNYTLIRVQYSCREL